MTDHNKLYNEWHLWRDENEVKFQVLNDPWYKTVISILPDLTDKKILEIGCGRGDFSIWLAQHFPTCSIIGTDFSIKAIEIANSKSNFFNLKFQVENAEELSFADNTFDYIISCETLEHVLHPQLMLNEICRVLKRGGEFVLTTENYFNGMTLAWIKTWITGQPFNSGSGVQPHENYFLFFYVKRLFKKTALKITSTKSNGFQWLLLPKINPNKLSTYDFESPLLKKIFKPFGRHYTFIGTKK